VNFVQSAGVPPLRGVVPPLGSIHTGFHGNFFNASRNRFRGGNKAGSQFGWPFWGYGDWYGGDYAAYTGDYVAGYQAQTQSSVVVLPQNGDAASALTSPAAT
jgi:hypothetical protein